MSLFNRLGKKVEEFKQEAESASRDEATHRCPACETRFYTAHEVCPECGHDVVEALDTA
jgi:rRNA maturation endonuclease Nob1